MVFNSSRRKLVAHIPLLAASAALPSHSAHGATQDSTEQSTPNTDLPEPDGHLCIPIYNTHRFPLKSGERSVLAVINVKTGHQKYVKSPVPTLHGLLRPHHNNPNRQTLGIGQDSPELLEIFDTEFKQIKVNTFPGIKFRGHGINHPDGVLVMAESLDHPELGGMMLLLTSDGKLIEKAPTGGLRPHEIVDCGKYYAIAHYGDLTTHSSSGASYEIINPGVSFIEKESLALHSFVALPKTGLIGHLAVNAHNEVIALSSHSIFTKNLQGLYKKARDDNAILLDYEVDTLRYRMPYPLYEINPQSGQYREAAHPASTMRRGQSIDFDEQTQVLTATYAASQTLLIREPGRPDRFISTLPLGIAEPRGCAAMKGHGLIAISGNRGGVAVLDPISGQFKRYFGMALGGHSHLFWFDAKE